MTEQRGWGIPEQCLLPDAVVAFVDGELSPVAHDRVVAHISRCAQCAVRESICSGKRASATSISQPGSRSTSSVTATRI